MTLDGTRLPPAPVQLLAAVSTLILLAGCGGEDESASEFPPGVAQPIEKVEFLREADRICLSGDSRIEAAADDVLAGDSEPSPEQVRRLALRIVVPALEAEVRAIDSIGVPPGDEAFVKRILAASERGIAEIERDPVALLDGPPQGLRDAGRLARRYGSQQCGVR